MIKCEPNCPGYLVLKDAAGGPEKTIPCPKCATKNAKVKG